MKNLIEIANELALRLSSFGKTEETKAVISAALDANEWFTTPEILTSIEAISKEMLNSKELGAWINHYETSMCRETKSIAIIMAGNIPLVGFFDLLCTLAAGHHAWVKPSSKDRVLMESVIGEIKAIEPNIPIYIYNDSRNYDAVIATGGIEANRYFESRFSSAKRLCRSSRHSIAVLSGDENSNIMELLAEDIYTYSGLGCRNVSTIFAPRGSRIEIPSYSTHLKYRNNYLQMRAALSVRGVEFEDNGSSIIVRTRELPASLSQITIWEYDSIDEVYSWIKENDDTLQCIVSRCIDHPRKVDFGEAQHPTLFDYADGVDTMRFLEFND